MKRVLSLMMILLLCCGCSKTYSEAELAQARESAYNEGYQSGYSDGETETHDAAYQEGHDAGLQEGQTLQQEELTAATDQGYQTGYNAGYADGKKGRAASPSTSAGTGSSGNAASGSAGGSGGSAANTATDTVYVTAKGKKYHTSSCSYLSSSKISIALADAKASGYTPCSRCHPPQ